MGERGTGTPANDNEVGGGRTEWNRRLRTKAAGPDAVRDAMIELVSSMEEGRGGWPGGASRCDLTADQ